jgi:hypothetical protein
MCACWCVLSCMSRCLIHCRHTTGTWSLSYELPVFGRFGVSMFSCCLLGGCAGFRSVRPRLVSMLVAAVLGLGSVLFATCLTLRRFASFIFFHGPLCAPLLSTWVECRHFVLIVAVWCIDGCGWFGLRLWVEGVVCFCASVSAAWVVVLGFLVVVNRLALQWYADLGI